MFILSLLIFSLHAEAVPYVYEAAKAQNFDQAVAQGLFYKPEEAPFVSRNFARANAATVRFQEVDETCTGVILSPDGYVATAAHCVKACVLPSYGYTPPIPSVVMGNEIYNAIAFPERKFVPFECPMDVASELAIDDYQMQSPKVVWMGRGLFAFSNLTKVPEADFARVRDLDEDVAILKYDVYNPTSRALCVPVAKAKPAEGKASFVLGFPVPGDPYFNGFHKALSLGRTRARINQDPIIQNAVKTLGAILLQRFEIIWGTPSQVLSTAPVAHGNSGGAMLDEDGELVGILFTGDGVGHKYAGQTSVGTSMPDLREQIANELGRPASEQIFNCPADSVATLESSTVNL